VIVIALATFVIWYLWVGQEFSYSLLKAVAVLIIACPCALGLATPIAVVLGVGKAAENKILFNNAEAIENVNKVRTIVFDKTGTLTYAKFRVSEVTPVKDLKAYDGKKILKTAASLEQYSEHPIARAIVEHYRVLYSNETLYAVEDFKAISGIGVEARINGNEYKLGGANLIEKNNYKDTEHAESFGTSGLYFFENNKLIGEIKINDRIKDDANEVITRLRGEHYNLSLVSGDSKYATEEIANQLGITDYHYQILPDRKQEIIGQLQQKGNFVAMVGDGINDAPSLSKADLGIAIGTGQDIAIQSADVILVKGELRNLLALFKISHKTIRIIKQNLFWAFFYNAAAIPLAAGVLVPWGISVSPVMASMFMALSDVITVLGNSMRLKYMKVN
jgi:heavy metal translocating P-type ATPase